MTRPGERTAEQRDDGEPERSGPERAPEDGMPRRPVNAEREAERPPDGAELDLAALPV